MVGPGNATVAVAADMSYESANRVEESFVSPENAPALNEATTTEAYTGGGAGGAAGVLGPDNIAVPGDGAGDGTFNSETSTRNNAVNKVTETREIPAGALNRQTVSVALNTEAAAGLNLNNVEALVATAAGINAERGDQLTVEMVAFNTGGAQAAQDALAAAAESAEAERRAQLMNNIIQAAGIVLAVLLLMVFYAVRSRRQNREAIDIGELPELDPLAPATKLAMIGQSEPATTAISMSTDTAGIPIVPIARDSTERKRVEVDALAGQDPARTAEYLRTFMDEGQPV
jgi:flagellar M-ring protein FliF